MAYVGYKQQWHRNIQNMSPMTIYMIFNMLQGLLGNRRRPAYGGMGGMGGMGGGGFGRRRGMMF